ncbi:Similar to Orcokinin peptides (Apis mellifera), partial [Cotesia congregata]
HAPQSLCFSRVSRSTTLLTALLTDLRGEVQARSRKVHPRVLVSDLEDGQFTIYRIGVYSCCSHLHFCGTDSKWGQRNGNPIDARVQKRNLDQIGGGNLLRSLQEQNLPYHVRNLDPITWDHLLRSHLSSYQQQNQELQSPRDDSHAGHLRQPSRLVFERDSDLRRKSGWPNTVNGVEIYEGALKRNMDEIDRTGFDNFVKRNFDEIDRSGWDSFVKRRIANAYFSGRQH